MPDNVWLNSLHEPSAQWTEVAMLKYMLINQKTSGLTGEDVNYETMLAGCNCQLIAGLKFCVLFPCII